MSLSPPMPSLGRAGPRGRLAQIMHSRAARLLIPVLVTGIALVALHGLSREVRWSDVRTDLAQAQPLHVLLAGLGTATSFLGVACYDVLAVRRVAPGVVPPALAAATSAGGNATSSVLGFSYLTGMAVRYHIYSGLGLDLGKVGAILGAGWVAFWGANLLATGLVLLLWPAGLNGILHIGRTPEIAVGAAILGGLAGGLLWTATRERPPKVFGHAVALPDPVTLAALILAGLVDLMGAALTLWVLLPTGLGATLPGFLVLYIVAVGLGLVSHAPGGIGVFEATIIAGLGAAGRSDVLVALLLYRVVYYLLPFGLALLGLAALWLRGHRGRLAGPLAAARKMVEPAIPVAAAALALLSGLVLLVSGTLPGEGAHMGALRALVPLPLVELSHLAGSIVGLLLVVLARGLYGRLWRAWLLALLLLGLGAAASLAKGLDLTEAAAMGLAALILASFRGAFYRVEGGPLLRLNASALVALLALLGATLWLGALVHAHTEYSADLWWRFAWRGDASRFLRAELALAVATLALAANSLLRSGPPPAPPEPIPAAVRRLVAESPDTEAPLALLGDKSFLLDPQGRAFLCYADTGHTLVTKGDPVGDPQAGRSLIRAFREMADRKGRRCAFYAVSTRYLPAYLDLGLSIMKIGEIAIVPLRDFSLTGHARKGLRHALGRAARDGLHFEIVPAAGVPALLPELAPVSEAWLAMRSGEEKGFALGAFVPEYLANFDHAVLRSGLGGPVIAFANLLRGAGHAQLSIDLMRYGPEAPGYAMDAMILQIMLHGAAEGYEAFSLGAAPFAGLEAGRLAPLWSRAGALVYRHGEPIYHFEGLRAWKQKFDPTWVPNYLACPGWLNAPAVLYEVNVLISGGLRGLLR